MSNVLRTPIYSPLYYDYLAGRSELLRFFPSLHRVRWDQQAGKIDHKQGVYREMLPVLIRQNSDATGAAARGNLEKLRGGRCFVVATGQQLGLFGGPLYTIYKAITAIRLAREIESTAGDLSCVPVFWLESDDHDIEEIDHFGIWTRDHQPQKIRYEGERLDHVSIRHYQISAEIATVLDTLRQVSRETEFTPDLLSRLEELYRPGTGWVEAIRGFLSDLFHESGLLFFQPGDPEVKKLSLPFVRDYLARIGEVRDEFSKRSEQLRELDYPNQVTDIAGKTYLHIEQDDGRRSHLYAGPDGFYFQDDDQRLTEDGIMEIITADPGRLSTAVITRPILQSWLMPVVSYVAGPAEIAYWAQLGGLFSLFSLTMPVVYPRITATIIDQRVKRYIDKHALDLSRIPVKEKEFIDGYFKAHRSDQVDPLKGMKDCMDRSRTEISAYLDDLDQTLVPVGEKTFDRIRSQIENLENRIIKSREQQESTLVSHLKQIHATVFPDGYPQERFISIIYYMNMFGPEVVRRLTDGLELKPFDHQIHYL